MHLGLLELLESCLSRRSLVKMLLSVLRVLLNILRGLEHPHCMLGFGSTWYFLREVRLGREVWKLLGGDKILPEHGLRDM